MTGLGQHCSHGDCRREVICRALCETHYTRQRMGRLMDGQFQCDQCDYDTNSRSWLSRHTRAAHDAVLRCDADGCGRKPIAGGSCSYHYYKGEDALTFGAECPICKRAIVDWPHVRVHARRKHGVELEGEQCEFPGCDVVAICQGYCGGHDKQLRQRGAVESLTPLHAGRRRSGWGCVYALTDPVTDEVRYIGQTRQHPDVRLRSHQANPSNAGMARWLDDLEVAGASPLVVVLDSSDAIDQDHLDDMERDAIALWAVDSELLNVHYNTHKVAA